MQYISLIVIKLRKLILLICSRSLLFVIQKPSSIILIQHISNTNPPPLTQSPGYEQGKKKKNNNQHNVLTVLSLPQSCFSMSCWHIYNFRGPNYKRFSWRIIVLLLVTDVHRRSYLCNAAGCHRMSGVLDLWLLYL